jgi:hypothetical protein
MDDNDGQHAASRAAIPRVAKRRAFGDAYEAFRNSLRDQGYPDHDMVDAYVMIEEQLEDAHTEFRSGLPEEPVH